MARKKTLVVNFEPFDAIDYTYPEDSAKAGKTTKRLKLRDRTIESLFSVFGGNRETLIRFVETKLSPVYVASLEDPDKPFRSPAIKLLALDFFSDRGLTAADKGDPTKAEIAEAIEMLKDKTRVKS
jgi:hypothetical protein